MSSKVSRHTPNGRRNRHRPSSQSSPSRTRCPHYGVPDAHGSAQQAAVIPQHTRDARRSATALRKLRAHQIIERIPRARIYQVTADGLTIALFFARLTQRLLIPDLAQLTSTGPPPGAQLHQAGRAYKVRSQNSPSSHPSPPDHSQWLPTTHASVSAVTHDPT